MVKTSSGQNFQPKNLDLNKDFKKALRLMEKTKKNVFITGRAGTGKSTLLEYFRKKTQKQTAVLAPTGVAAVNIHGQTIHSFFGFKPDITLEKVKKKYFKDPSKNIYQKLEEIIIDEISMVRADLLDCVDKFMRLNGKYKKLPFGGLQMIFFGDLYQLPPVVTGKEREIFKTYYQSQYFFDAHVFENFEMEFIELGKIYRQHDQSFIDLLNAVRNRSISEQDLQTINQRYHPDFEFNDGDFYIYLTTTNAMAAEINEQRLLGLSGKLFRRKGQISGEFDLSHLPTDTILRFKKNSQIMLLNNDPSSRWINGSIGKIVEIFHENKSGEDIVLVELNNGKMVEVTPFTWEIYRFQFNRNTNSLESETIGSFTQYPFKLAWAVTIHKSQGKTFDKVVIDIGRGTFAHGQAYVALSRCTTLEGIILKKQIEKKHILLDWRIVKFLTNYQYKLADKKYCAEDKVELIKRAAANKFKLKMVYLKTNDEKSERVIQPYSVGKMEYLGKTYLGMEAFCYKRQDDRVFRIDRILKIEEFKA